jgi:hypothetical protein
MAKTKTDVLGTGESVAVVSLVDVAVVLGDMSAKLCGVLTTVGVDTVVDVPYNGVASTGLVEMVNGVATLLIINPPVTTGCDGVLTVGAGLDGVKVTSPRCTGVFVSPRWVMFVDGLVDTVGAATGVGVFIPWVFLSYTVVIVE